MTFPFDRKEIRRRKIEIKFLSTQSLLAKSYIIILLVLRENIMAMEIFSSIALKLIAIKSLIFISPPPHLFDVVAVANLFIFHSLKSQQLCHAL